MSKIFPQTVKKVQVTTVIIVSGGDVTDERLTYDLPERYPPPQDAAAVVVSVAETSPAPIELGILAVLLNAFETHATPVDPTTLEAEIQERHAAGQDAATIVASIAERYAVPLDTVTVEIEVLTERHPAAQEDVSGTEAQFQIEESHPAARHITDIEARVAETHPSMDDEVTVDAVVEEVHAVSGETVDVVASIAERHPATNEEITADVRVAESAPASADEVAVIASIAESVPTATDDISGTEAQFQVEETSPAVIEVVTVDSRVAESHATQVDDIHTCVTGNLWPDTVVTGTGFTNTANAVDKLTNTAATCSASSSGLGQLTSNTTNGTLVISAPNPNLSDLDTIGSAVIRYSYSTSTNSLLSPAVNMAIQYSLNDGGSWTTIETVTSTSAAQADHTLDITAIVGNDWTKVNGFRMRCTGSVTSGQGTVVITATTSFNFFFGRLELDACKFYGDAFSPGSGPLESSGMERSGGILNTTTSYQKVTGFVAKAGFTNGPTGDSLFATGSGTTTVVAQLQWNASQTAEKGLRVMKNGIQIGETINPNGNPNQTQNLSLPGISIIEGDEIWMEAYSANSSSIAGSASANLTYLQWSV